MTPDTRPPLSEIDFLTPRELLEQGIKTDRLEKVSVGSLNLDESIVDEDHVEDLKDSMGGERGQLIPLCVRARLNETGEIEYDIIDGFHRGAALKLLGKEFADCKVVYGCDDEEFYDLRVTAALSVSSVSFPRIVKWMKLSYAETKFAKSGMSLLQAISLTAQDSSGVRFKNLSTEDIVDVKKWVRNKAKKWKKNVAVLYQDMSAVEQADPGLVEKVRLGAGGGHEGSGVFNPARFKAMVGELPQDFDMQRIVYELIVKFNLDQFEVAKVAKAIGRARNDENTIQMMMTDPVSVAQGVLSGGDEEEEKVDNQSLTVGRMVQEERKRGKDRTGNGGSAAYTRVSQKALEEENARLKESLKIASVSSEKTADGKKGGPLWYMMIPDLSATERQVMELAFGEGAVTIDEISDKTGLTPNKIIQLLISGHTKYWHSRQGRKLREIVERVKKREE